MTKKITNYRYNVISSQTGKEEEESTAKVIANLLLLYASTNSIKGIDQFRQYHKLFKAIREAEKEGFLELNDKDHEYIKKIVKEEIPSTWGANSNIFKVVENILNA